MNIKYKKIFELVDGTFMSIEEEAPIYKSENVQLFKHEKFKQAWKELVIELEKKGLIKQEIN